MGINKDFIHQSPLRNRKLHLEMNTLAMMTILWLLLLVRILYCWQSTLQMESGKSPVEANLGNE